MTPQHSDHNEVDPDIHSDQSTTVNPIISVSALKCREFIEKFSEYRSKVNEGYLAYLSYSPIESELFDQQEEITTLITNGIKLLEEIGFPDFYEIYPLCSELDAHRDKLIELIISNFDSTSPHDEYEKIFLRDKDDVLGKKIRQFLFLGEIQIALFRYRDHQKIPVNGLAEKEINQIEKSHQIFLTAIEEINQSLEDHFLANLITWKENLVTLRKTTEIIQSYKDHNNRSSNLLVGKDDYHIIRRSFIDAITPIFLENYSFISAAIVKKLITIKSIHHLGEEFLNTNPSKDPSSINLIIRKSIEKAATKAKIDGWHPTKIILLNQFIGKRKTLSPKVKAENKKQEKENEKEQKKVEGVKKLSAVMTGSWNKPLAT